MSVFGLKGGLASAFVLAMTGAVAAQTTITPTQTVPLTVEQVPPTTQGQPTPAPAVVTAPGTETQDVPPGDPETANIERIFVDTGVSNVRVSDVLTVATMNRSPLSNCPSNEYIYERDRPKWLFQTGRLLQAMKEGATVRISFSCINGFQSINAMQFLSAPGVAVARTVPTRDQAVDTVVITPTANTQAIPLPTPTSAATDASLTREERIRQIPLP
ncbi:MAG: hypothetical protein AAGF45_02760 [Pseudomonadota bacterium]